MIARTKNIAENAPARSPSNRIVERLMEGPDGIACHVQVNLGESPLSWLHARGRLSDRHYCAGEALRRDWERAGLGPRVTMSWNPAPAHASRRGTAHGNDPGIMALSARERFDGAMQAAGRGLSDILWRVACAGEGLSAAERALEWPSRAGKLVLTLALDRVAEFYRIE
jgi:hypothetical protein